MGTTFDDMKKALFQLHIAVFLAGFTAILGKLISLNEGLLVGYRMLFTVLILLFLLYYRRQLERVHWREMLRIAGVGLIVALHWVTFYGSVKYANVSVALVCFSATGFFTALLEPLILRKRIALAELVLGLLSILGIYIIFDFHPGYKLGIFFGILSAVGSAAFPIFNKQLLERHAPRTLTLYELAGGFIALLFILPVYLYYFPATEYIPRGYDWLWLIILAWLCTVVSFDLQLNALKKLSAFTANLTYNLEPVYGILLAFVIFKENTQLQAEFYAGVALILLAVLLQMLRLKKQQPDRL